MENEINIGFKERSNKALQKAAKLKGSGNILASEMGVTRQSLYYTKMSNGLIPYEKAIKICMVTKGMVSLYELRPDLEKLTREFVEFVLKRSGNV